MPCSCYSKGTKTELLCHVNKSPLQLRVCCSRMCEHFSFPQKCIFTSGVTPMGFIFCTDVLNNIILMVLRTKAAFKQRMHTKP